MKAIVYTEYGPPDVLELKEVEKPANYTWQIEPRQHCMPCGRGWLTWNHEIGQSTAQFTN